MLSKTVARLAALAAAAAYSLPSYALFDAQATIGKRFYQWEGPDVNNGNKVSTHGVQSQEVTVSAHLSPIPLVPIGFGALINVGSPDQKDLSWTGNVTDAKVFQAALDFTAWLSIVPVLTPFVRVTVPVYSAVAIKSKVVDPTNSANSLTYASTGKLGGYHLDLGAKLGFLPLVQFLLEVGTGAETYKVDELKSNGVKITGDKDRAVKSSSVALGVEVGI